VTPVRSFELDHAEHRLTICDEFEGEGEHRLEIPLHLATGIEIERQEPGRLVLRSEQRSFMLTWEPMSMWELRIEPGRISPSYGIALPSTTLIWKRIGHLQMLAVTLQPMQAVTASDPTE
jgi:hypothetical protein